MCESTQVAALDSGGRRRYKCQACAALLYGARGPGNTRTFRAYACRHIGKDPMTEKRRLICDNPATHATGANTYCKEHGAGPPSHVVASKRRKKRKASAETTRRQREADMSRFADQQIKTAREEMESRPLPTPVKDTGRVGGVHIW